MYPSYSSRSDGFSSPSFARSASERRRCRANCGIDASLTPIACPPYKRKIILRLVVFRASARGGRLPARIGIRFRGGDAPGRKRAAVHGDEADLLARCVAFGRGLGGRSALALFVRPRQ